MPAVTERLTSPALQVILTSLLPGCNTTGVYSWFIAQRKGEGSYA